MVASKLLLDTHVALWVAGSPSRLGREAIAMIRSATEVAISSISIAEINMKAMTGNLKKPDDLVRRFESARYEIAGFSAEAATEIERFGSLAKHDPFDRLLLAQASVGGYKLLTADAKLLDQGFDFVIDAEI